MKFIHALFAVCLLSSCMIPMLPVAPQNPAADVALPLSYRSGAPHVMAGINGRSVPLLLDTGATTTVFEPEIATDCGLLPASPRRVEVRGVHGSVGASRATISSLNLGSWRGTDVPCLVRGRSSFRPGGLGSAILGMDHFRRLCSFLTIDYRSSVVELGFSRPFRPQTGNVRRAPIWWVNGIPLTRVSSGGLSWDAVVDTGSSWGIVVDQSTAARLGHARDGLFMGDQLILTGVGGSMTANQAGARVIRVSSVSLCGETFPGATLFVLPGPKRVGSRFWHGSRLTLDFRSNSLWLEH